MKKINFILLLLSLIYHNSIGGNINELKDTGSSGKDFGQEAVFVHYNSTLLFSGETLYYKFYCRDLQSGKHSELSKIGYLELINSKKEIVFKHLLNLEKGTGQGEFFIPVNVPSGTYKLIGYTRWMKNAGEKNFFEGDLVVINPYQDVQGFVGRGEEIVQDDKTEFSGGSQVITKSGNLQLLLPSGEFSRRSKIEFKLKSPERLSGNVSISVHRKEALTEVVQPDPHGFTNFSGKLSQKAAGGIESLPDLRGQLITGRIKLKNDELISSLAGLKVGVSIPGKEFFLRIVTVNKQGEFRFNLDPAFLDPKVYLQVLGQDRNSFEIELDPLPVMEYGNLEFPVFQINQEMEQAIKERSIFSQIENNYLEARRDSLIPAKEKIPFYGSVPEVYNLDDFTRFPTVRETFVEIIHLVKLRRDRTGEFFIDVLMETSSEESGLKSLVVVDGLMVRDHGELVDFDARKIKRIGVIRDKYFLGNEAFQGVLIVESVEGDFYNFVSGDSRTIIELERPQLKKEYRFPVYDEKSKNERIPDFRTQLFWKPELILNARETEISFFTSDVSGEYEIRIEGFCNDGTPVFLLENFTVQ